jgi:hypothetical protein
MFRHGVGRRRRTSREHQHERGETDTQPDTDTDPDALDRSHRSHRRTGGTDPVRTAGAGARRGVRGREWGDRPRCHRLVGRQHGSSSGHSPLQRCDRSRDGDAASTATATGTCSGPCARREWCNRTVQRRHRFVLCNAPRHLLTSRWGIGLVQVDDPWHSLAPANGASAAGPYAFMITFQRFSCTEPRGLVVVLDLCARCHRDVAPVVEESIAAIGIEPLREPRQRSSR